MQVYRSSAELCSTRQALEQHAARLDGGDSVEAAREQVIEFGELEAAIVDGLCPKSDRSTPLTRALRRTSAHLAGRFLAALDGEPARASAFRERARGGVHHLLSFELPQVAELKTPEGFAYYGLYPEQYRRAAEQAYEHFKPARAVVLGLRSIGTSLASVVEATLARHACHVSSYALRPHGHPYDRELRCEGALEAELAAKTDAHFLIVDEGPGLSGSSLTCVARALRRLGVRSSRIAFLPSYSSDGTHFVSPLAQQTWHECSQFSGDFELSFIQRAARGAELHELSAGAWRQAFGVEARAIASHPQHERRKYLARGADGRAFLLRFAGFGAHGRRVRARAEILERSGITPRVLGDGDGMLLLEHVRGRAQGLPLAGSRFFDTLARYLVFRRDELDTGRPAELGPLAEMARQNIDEALGEPAGRALEGLLARALRSPARATITDGRLSAHEWLDVGGVYKKVDAFDHGDDHFYPGPCDIAWDVAGAAVELAGSAAAQRSWLARYATLANDPNIFDRFPFFEAAYLAFRLGYARLAAQTLANTEDGARFARLEQGYRSRLASRLLAVEA